MNIYQQELLDHYHTPRNKGSFERTDFSSAVHNPSCGDSVSFQGLVVDGKIDLLRFEGRGCVISQGIASILTERLKGMDLSAIMALDEQFIKELVGFPIGPTRLKCAMLPLQALQQGIGLYQAKD